MTNALRHIPLPEGFMAHPFAHRGLHDRGKGRVENSRAACEAAAAAGYAIEIDVQLSSDGEAMVFHDYELDRLTAEKGPLRGRAAADLSRIELKSGGETIPTLREVLSLIAGRVPLVVEIKDQDGGFGPNVGPLEQRVGELLAAYDGSAAAMSFNPHAVRALGEAAAEVPRGLVSYDWPRRDVPWMSYGERQALADMIRFEELGCAFCSYGAKALPAQGATRVRVEDHPVLCWTIRSPLEAARVLRHADQITFEGYLPPVGR